MSDRDPSRHRAPPASAAAEPNEPPNEPPNDPIAVDPETVDAADLAATERILMLAFDERRREHLPEALRSHRRGVRAIRGLRLAGAVAPASVFEARGEDDPLPPPLPPAGASEAFGRRADDAGTPAFLTIAEIAAAFRRGELRSRDLTDTFLRRIERWNATLFAVVEPLADRARAEADRADQELAAGIDRGPLHGVPYLAKDLLAVPDAPTTWGAAPFRDQRLPETAAVVERLEAAGAVLLGKASLGALAMGDVWFGGTTRNPWDLEQGSSGSSAGSASGVAAGLCTFAIGSETMGSILSPADRCGVVGLRPTFGRVSRHGAMALSWSLDKLGPLTRSVEDAALVLTGIAGTDARDPATREAPFPWDPSADPSRLRIGVPSSALHDPTPTMASFLETLQAAGGHATAIELPDLPTEPIMTLLMVEAAAAFDELIRGEDADVLVRQDDGSWPTLLRAARFVSGVDYVQAQRLQRVVGAAMAELFGRVDLIVTPGAHSRAMLLGNAAGAPALSLPTGEQPGGRPLGNVAIMARPFFEHQALALGHAVQRRQGPLRAPPGFGD